MTTRNILIECVLDSRRPAPELGCWRCWLQRASLLAAIAMLVAWRCL